MEFWTLKEDKFCFNFSLMNAKGKENLRDKFPCDEKEAVSENVNIKEEKLNFEKLYFDEKNRNEDLLRRIRELESELENKDKLIEEKNKDIRKYKKLIKTIGTEYNKLESSSNESKAHNLQLKSNVKEIIIELKNQFSFLKESDEEKTKAIEELEAEKHKLLKIAKTEKDNFDKIFDFTLKQMVNKEYESIKDDTEKTKIILYVIQKYGELKYIIKNIKEFANSCDDPEACVEEIRELLSI